MIIGKVISPLVATVKHPFFAGRKMLVVKEINADGSLGSKPYVALDSVQSGIGDVVLVAKNGGAVDDVVGQKECPENLVIVALVERVERLLP